jgi:protein SCO1
MKKRALGFGEKTIFIVIVLVAVVASAGFWLMQKRVREGQGVLQPIGTPLFDTQFLRQKFPNFLIYPRPKQIAEFRLQDTSGKPIGKDFLKGQYTLLTFGFTACPDVCPTTLSEVNVILKSFPESMQKPRVVFVAIDPERDLRNDLKGYVTTYNPNFEAMSGDISALTTFAANMGAVFEKQSLDPDADPKDAAGLTENYTMMHTSSLYLLSPEAELVAVIRPKLNVNDGVSEFDWPGLKNELPQVLTMIKTKLK